MSTGIYIHLPYCLSKCPYCDFNSYGTGYAFPEDNYTDSVLVEIDLYGDLIQGRNIETVFFGGGTPSLFSPRSIENILERISGYTRLSGNAEISIEVNPRTADVQKLEQFRKAGINRISIGIQSFLQTKLDYFKRFCTPGDCFKTIDGVVNAGFENFNLDLMYGAENESLDDLRFDLECAAGNANKHISVYCLTIEENTEFGRMYREGRLKLPEDEVLTEMYTMTSEFLEERGFRQYETSNFSVPGYECRHNLLYWRSLDYIAFGAGAHSHIRNSETNGWGERWSNIRTPRHYMNTVLSGNKPVEQHEELTKEASVQDTLMMGLRLRDGIDTNMLKNRYDLDIEMERYSHLFEDGFIAGDNNRIWLTRKGYLYTNSLILDIVSSIRY